MSLRRISVGIFRLGLVLTISPLVVVGQDNYILLRSFYDPGPSTNSLWLGSSAAIEGSIAVVGAPGTHAFLVEFGNIGGAAVFDLNTGRRLKWLEPTSWIEPNAGAGRSVSISGQRIAVGAPGYFTSARGSVYLYDSSITNASPIARIDGRDGSQFGTAVALSGDRMVVGAPSLGRGYASLVDLSLSDGDPRFQSVIDNPDPTNYYGFGSSVSMSGGLAAIAAYRCCDLTSAAWIYDLGSDSPTRPMATLKTPGAGGLGYFFPKVAISGQLVVMGVPGKAFVFDLRSVTATNPILTLTNPIPSDNSYAWSVAISGTRIVVGAGESEVGGYVYDLTSPTASNPIRRLYRPGPNSDSGFGQSVAIYDSTILVGAPRDASSQRPGGAYVYGVQPTLHFRVGAPGKASISWSPGTPGFVLEAADQLGSGRWSGTIFTNGVTIDATNGQGFYRLRLQ